MVKDHIVCVVYLGTLKVTFTPKKRLQ